MQKISHGIATFKELFHNSIYQENISNSTKVQYQEGFLTDLFIVTPGYTKKTKNRPLSYNRIQEY
jgi:hypothetical protein